MSLAFYTSRIVPLKCAEKKKLLGRNSKEIQNLSKFTPLRNNCLITFKALFYLNY